MATRRAQNEYLIAFGFVLIVGLFMAVVAWSSGTGSGKSSDASGLLQPNAEVAAGFTATQDFTAAQTGSDSGHLTGLTQADGTEFVASNPLSLAAPDEETPNQVLEQTQSPSREATIQPATSALETSWNYSTPAPGMVGGSSVGGSYGRQAPSTSGGSSGGSSGGYSPSGGMSGAATGSQGKAEAANAAPAESAATAHVSGARAGTGGPTALAGTFVSGLAASNLSAPSMIADSGSIPQLGEGHGNSVALDQPALGIGSSSFASTPAQELVAVPEPATLLLLGTGLALLSPRMRRRRRSPSGRV